MVCITLYEWFIILCLNPVSLVVMAFFSLRVTREENELFLFFFQPFPHSKNAFTTKVIYSAFTAILGYQLKKMYALGSMHLKRRLFLSRWSFEAGANFGCCVRLENSKWPSSLNVVGSNVQYFVFKSLLFKCKQFDTLLKVLCRKISRKNIKFILGRKELIGIMG